MYILHIKAPLPLGAGAFCYLAQKLNPAPMPDPITTIITTVVEHAPSTAAIAAIYKAAKGFLAKVAGPAVEELGEIGRDHVKGWRAKNSSQVLAGADTLLAETGREPQAVPLKTLLPLLDAASLEEEALLVDRWAALLANAADPAQKAQVQPAFIEILRQLTAADAQVVEALYKAAENASGTEAHHMVSTEGLMSRTGLMEQQMRLSLDNLLRLQLCKPVLTYGGYSAESYQAPSALLMTTLGLRFVQAVTAPGKNIAWPFQAN